MSNASLPSTMRVVQHDISKSTLTLTSGPVPIPDFAKQQHLIKVLTVAPCAGELTWPRPAELTISVPGVDAVGIIVTCPPSSPFEKGDRVYYRTQYPNPGSLRDYSLATSTELALAPTNLSAIDAAAVPVSALTAYQALFEQFSLPSPTSTPPVSNRPKPRILINGASGSSGTWALQLSRLANLTTIATASPKNADFVKSLGADEIIDYTSTTPAAWASTPNPDGSSKKVDLIFDAVGRSSLDTLWPALKPHGKLLTIVPPANMDFTFVPAPAPEAEGVEEGVSGKFFIMHPDSKHLGEITKLVEEGKCRGVFDSVFSMEEYAEAFKRTDSGRAVGKVVIKVGAE